MKQVPFTFDRWSAVRLQAAQTHERPSLAFGEQLAAAGPSWAYEDEDGQTVAVGGFYPLAPAKAAAWMYLDQHCARHMVGLVRSMARALDEVAPTWPVIYATVLRGFAPGRRLVLMLGFESAPHGPEMSYAGGTRVYDLFQRVSDGRQ